MFYKKIGILESHLIYDVLMDPLIGNNAYVIKEALINLLNDKNFEIDFKNILTKNISMNKNNNIYEIFNEYIRNSENIIVIQDIQFIYQIKNLKNNCLLFFITLENHLTSLIIEKNKNNYNLIFMNSGLKSNISINNNDNKNNEITMTNNGIIIKNILKIYDLTLDELLHIKKSIVKCYTIDDIYYKIFYFYCNKNKLKNDLKELFDNEILKNETLKNENIMIKQNELIQASIRLSTPVKGIHTLDVMFKHENKKYDYYDFYAQNTGNCSVMSYLIMPLFYIILKYNNYNYNYDDDNNSKLLIEYMNFVKKFTQHFLLSKLKNVYDDLNIFYHESNIYNTIKIINKKYDKHYDNIEKIKYNDIILQHYKKNIKNKNLSIFFADGEKYTNEINKNIITIPKFKLNEQISINQHVYLSSYKIKNINDFCICIKTISFSNDITELNNIIVNIISMPDDFKCYLAAIKTLWDVIFNLDNFTINYKNVLQYYKFIINITYLYTKLFNIFEEYIDILCLIFKIIMNILAKIYKCFNINNTEPVPEVVYKIVDNFNGLNYYGEIINFKIDESILLRFSYDSSLYEHILKCYKSIAEFMLKNDTLFNKVLNEKIQINLDINIRNNNIVYDTFKIRDYLVSILNKTNYDKVNFIICHFHDSCFLYLILESFINVIHLIKNDENTKKYINETYTNKEKNDAFFKSLDDSFANLYTILLILLFQNHGLNDYYYYDKNIIHLSYIQKKKIINNVKLTYDFNIFDIYNNILSNDQYRDKNIPLNFTNSMLYMYKINSLKDIKNYKSMHYIKDTTDIKMHCELLLNIGNANDIEKCLNLCSINNKIYGLFISIYIYKLLNTTIYNDMFNKIISETIAKLLIENTETLLIYLYLLMLQELLNNDKKNIKKIYFLIDKFIDNNEKNKYNNHFKNIFCLINLITSNSLDNNILLNVINDEKYSIIMTDNNFIFANIEKTMDMEVLKYHDKNTKNLKYITLFNKNCNDISDRIDFITFNQNINNVNKLFIEFDDIDDNVEIHSYTEMLKYDVDLNKLYFLKYFVFIKQNSDKNQIIFLGIPMIRDLSKIIVCVKNIKNIRNNINIDFVNNNDFIIYKHDDAIIYIFVSLYDFIKCCDKYDKKIIKEFLIKILLHNYLTNIIINHEISSIKNIFTLQLLDVNKTFEIDFNSEKITIEKYEYVDNLKIINKKCNKWLLNMKNILLFENNENNENDLILLIMNKLIDTAYDNDKYVLDVMSESYVATNVNKIKLQEIFKLLQSLITNNVYFLKFSYNYEMIEGNIDAIVTYLFYSYIYNNTYVIKKLLSIVSQRLCNEKINYDSNVFIYMIVNIKFKIYAGHYYNYLTDRYLNNSITLKNIELIKNIVLFKNNNNDEDIFIVGLLMDKFNKNILSLSKHETYEVGLEKKNWLYSELINVTTKKNYDDIFDALNNFVKTTEKTNVKFMKNKIVFKDSNKNYSINIISSKEITKNSKNIKNLYINKSLPESNDLFYNTFKVFNQRNYDIDDIFNHNDIIVYEIGASYYQYLLYYEILFGSYIKKNQYLMIENMFGNITSKNIHIKHLTMGDGKSSYIIPLLSLKLIDISSVFIIVPNNLIDQTLKYVLIAGKVFDKFNKCEKINIISMNDNNYNDDYIKLVKANKNLFYKNKIIITTMYVLKKIILNEKSKTIINMINNSYFIIDEATELLDNSKNELNIEFGDVIFGISEEEHIIKSLIYEIVDICYFNAELMTNKYIKTESYNKAILDDRISDTVINYILKKNINKSLIEKYANYFKHTLIPSILNSIYNRHFGLNNKQIEKSIEDNVANSDNNMNDASCCKIAIPYIAEHLPSDNMFEDAYLIIAFTYISYKLSDDKILNNLLKIYIKNIKKTMNKYNEKNLVNYVKNQFKKDLLNENIDSIDFNDLQLNKNNLILILLDNAIKENISRCKTIYNISTVDLMQTYLLSYKIGLTGTPKEIVDIKIIKDITKNNDKENIIKFSNDCDNKLYDKYKKIISSVKNIVYTNLHIKNLCWIEGIKDKNNNLKYNCIVDLGSFLVNSKLETILKKLCEILKNSKYNDKNIKYIVYPDENKTKVFAIHDCQIDPNIKYNSIIDESFYYISQMYTVGYDVLMPIDSHALITFNPISVTLDDFMQAVYRLRQIEKGQTFSVAIPMINNNINNEIIKIENLCVSLKKICWLHSLMNNANNTMILDFGNYIKHDENIIMDFFKNNYSDYKLTINNVNKSNNLNLLKNIYLYTFEYLSNDKNTVNNVIKNDDVKTYLTHDVENISLLIKFLTKNINKNMTMIIKPNCKKLKPKILFNILNKNTENKISNLKYLYAIQLGNAYKKWFIYNNNNL